MTIALDPNGSSSGQVAGSTAALVTVTISTTNANDVIICDVIDAAAFSLAVVTSTSLTWTNHASLTGIGGSNSMSRWYAIASSPLSGEVVTVSGLGATFANVLVYSISGANTSTPFDAGGPVATQGTAIDPLSITTVNPNTMITGVYLESSASPTAGAGFTMLGTLSFSITEYAFKTSTGTYSVPIGTGAGTANGGIIDAIVQASAGGDILMSQIWL